MGFQQANGSHKDTQKWGEEQFEIVCNLKDIPYRPTTEQEQVTFGDYWMGKKTSVDVKTEAKWTGNSLLEHWSNKGKRAGWAFSLKSDVIVDIFKDVGALMFIDWKKARVKFKIEGEEPTKDWIDAMGETYREMSPHYNSNQYNQTSFFLIPMKDFEDVTIARYVYEDTGWRLVSDMDEWQAYKNAWTGNYAKERRKNV